MFRMGCLLVVVLDSERAFRGVPLLLVVVVSNGTVLVVVGVEMGATVRGGGGGGGGGGDGMDGARGCPRQLLAKSL